MGRAVGQEHWFPIYLQEIQRVEEEFNVREMGAMVKLLAYQWRHGSIPQGGPKLWEIVPEDPGTCRMVEQEFPKVQGRGAIRRNRKLHRLRQRMVAKLAGYEAEQDRQFDKAAGL